MCLGMALRPDVPESSEEGTPIDSKVNIVSVQRQTWCLEQMLPESACGQGPRGLGGAHIVQIPPKEGQIGKDSSWEK